MFGSVLRVLGHFLIIFFHFFGTISINITNACGTQSILDFSAVSAISHLISCTHLWLYIPHCMSHFITQGALPLVSKWMHPILSTVQAQKLISLQPYIKKHVQFSLYLSLNFVYIQLHIHVVLTLFLRAFFLPWVWKGLFPSKSIWLFALLHLSLATHPPSPSLGWSSPPHGPTVRWRLPVGHIGVPRHSWRPAPTWVAISRGVGSPPWSPHTQAFTSSPAPALLAKLVLLPVTGL